MRFGACMLSGFPTAVDRRLTATRLDRVVITRQTFGAPRAVNPVPTGRRWAGVPRRPLRPGSGSRPVTGPAVARPLLHGPKWIGVFITLSLIGWTLQAAAQGTVCERTDEVRDAILTASGVSACADLTVRDLREITSLDLHAAEVAALSAGDFDGLVRLDSLDLSDNLLTSLPAGVFDQLYVLKSLRLDGNQLAALPAGVFDQLFLLEELTLEDNLFAALPDNLFDAFSRFDGVQSNGAPPDNSADHPRIRRFLARHAVTSPEEFIAALPSLYRERFVMVYESESPAVDHVSGAHPRIVSWGADGQFIFAWNTDPDAPAEFRDGVEFLRQDDTAWTAGIVDFSGTTPSITEPESCRGCHGPLNKPLWGLWAEWHGSEYDFNGARVEIMDAIRAATDPRLEPLEFPETGFERGRPGVRFLVSPGGRPVVAAVEEAGAVWSWRHAEVLYRNVTAEQPDPRQWREDAACGGWNIPRRAFEHLQHNLFVRGGSDIQIVDGRIVGGTLSRLRPWGISPYIEFGYHYSASGSIEDAMMFLVLSDLWAEQPIVRRLYRATPNEDTVAAGTTGKSAMLHYASGVSNAEDELIQKLRLHFGRGGLPALDQRARQNDRFGQGGVLSAAFGVGHLDVMRPKVCSALRESGPTRPETALRGADVVLSWEAPVYDADAVTGYRILRGEDGGSPGVRVADSGSTDTTWTDASPPPGDYVYAVKTLYDGYYASPASNRASATVPDLAISAVPAKVDEGGTSTLSVTSLAGALGEDRTIALQVAGTASASDYQIAAGGQTLAAPYTLTLAAASTAVTATLSAVDDALEEPDETVTLTASYAGEDIGSTTVTILAGDTSLADDATLGDLRLSGIDIGAFAAATTSYAAAVANAVAGTTVTATPGDPAASIVIEDAQGSTAGATRTVSLAVGSNTVTVTVTAADGAATNTYRVTVTRAAALLTAAFEDLPASHDGSNPITFTLRFSEPIRNSYRILRDARLSVANGTARRARRVNGSSALWSIEVAPSGAQDVAVTLTPGGACNAGGICTAGGLRLSHSVNATVPGPAPSVSISAGAAVPEGSPALFTLQRSGSTAASLVVSVSVSETGAMLAGAPPATATFDTGSAIATLRVQTSDDRIPEASSVVTATVLSGAGYAPSARSSADVTVTDDDEVSFAFSVQPASIDEGGSSTLTVSTGGVTYADAQTIDLAVTGGTAAADDYALSPAVLTLAVGSTAVTSTFTAVDDAAAEPDETASVSASHRGAAVASATVTILASDAPSDDAALAALSLSGIELGTFSATATDYTADVAHGVSGTTVTATPNDANASVTIADPDGSTAGETRTVALAVGSNTITATVTAEDQATTRTYTLTVTRAAASLTASFEDLPASHDGASAFTFTLRFSAAVQSGARKLRDESLEVANGAATSASRVNGNKAVWSIEVTPSGRADAVVSLSAERACDAGGVCTPDGVRLSADASALVPGPAATAPDQVGQPTLTAGQTYLDASWSAPADNGSPIEGYNVEYREAGAAWTDAGHGGAGTSAHIAGLAADTAYDVRVRAVSAAGTGAWSPPASATTTGSGGPPEADLRLVDGANANEGRVEIYHAGEWGTVCDDSWSTNDAEVACRQLGHAGTATALGRAAFGEGTGQIWMDDMRCGGDEERLADCEFRGWGSHNCRHSEDAGVSCGAAAGALPADATLSGTLLTLRFGHPLDGVSTPSPQDFVVRGVAVGDTAPVTVTSVAVSGATALIGLSRRMLPDERVTLSYLEAAMHPLQDLWGNPAAAFADRPVRHVPYEPVPSGVGRPDPEAPAALLPAAAASATAKLERLDLSARRLTDTSALSGLVDLEVLDLHDNAVAEVWALSGLTGLDVLDLSGNRIVDLSPLSGLTGLRVLDLSGNRIEDVSALWGLTGLRRLNLSGNRIADIGALAGLTDLEVLLLDGNAVTQVLPLTGLANLAHLGLSGNRLAAVDLLAELGTLRRLDLAGNRLTDVSALGGLAGLAWLRLAGNPIRDVSVIGRLRGLRWLWLDARAGGHELLDAPAHRAAAPLPAGGAAEREAAGPR